MSEGEEKIQVQQEEVEVEVEGKGKVKLSGATGPRTVDIFRSTLSNMTHRVLDTLKRFGYFMDNSSFEAQGYAKFCVQMAAEIWILSFGVNNEFL